MQAPCPECDSPVAADESVRASEILICPECKTELEVIGTAPLLVALAPEIEEDWGE
jgi:alpha-aminoadipate carrier protein LysW